MKWLLLTLVVLAVGLTTEARKRNNRNNEPATVADEVETKSANAKSVKASANVDVADEGETKSARAKSVKASANVDVDEDVWGKSAKAKSAKGSVNVDGDVSAKSGGRRHHRTGGSGDADTVLRMGDLTKKGKKGSHSRDGSGTKRRTSGGSGNECSFTGDPHYSFINGDAATYMSVCCHRMIDLQPSAACNLDLRVFECSEKRGSKDATWAIKVYGFLNGVKFDLEDRRFTVDDIEHSVEGAIDTTGFNIIENVDKQLLLSFGSGATMKHWNSYNYKIVLSAECAAANTGACGTPDYAPTLEEFMTVFLADVSSGKPECAADAVDQEYIISAENARIGDLISEELVDYLGIQDEDFEDLAEVDLFITNGLIDLEGGMSYCAVWENCFDSAMEAGFRRPTESWRKSTSRDCSKVCGSNSKSEWEAGVGKAKTCRNPSLSTDVRDELEERCECVTGYRMNDDSVCVLKADCQCKTDAWLKEESKEWTEEYGGGIFVKHTCVDVGSLRSVDCVRSSDGTEDCGSNDAQPPIILALAGGAPQFAAAEAEPEAAPEAEPEAAPEAEPEAAPASTDRAAKKPGRRSRTVVSPTSARGGASTGGAGGRQAAATRTSRTRGRAAAPVEEPVAEDTVPAEQGVAVGEPAPAPAEEEADKQTPSRGSRQPPRGGRTSTRDTTRPVAGRQQPADAVRVTDVSEDEPVEHAVPPQADVYDNPDGIVNPKLPTDAEEQVLPKSKIVNSEAVMVDSEADVEDKKYTENYGIELTYKVEAHSLLGEIPFQVIPFDRVTVSSGSSPKFYPGERAGRMDDDDDIKSATVDLMEPQCVHGFLMQDNTHDNCIVKSFALGYRTLDGEGNLSDWQDIRVTDTDTVRAFTRPEGTTDSWIACLHRYLGKCLNAQFFRVELLEYENCAGFSFDLLGTRNNGNFGPLLFSLQMHDGSTEAISGCPCYWQMSGIDCACCAPNAAQCGPYSPHQCVSTGHGRTQCGTVHGMNAQCDFDKSLTTCQKCPSDQMTHNRITHRCDPAGQEYNVEITPILPPSVVDVSESTILENLPPGMGDGLDVTIIANPAEGPPPPSPEECVNTCQQQCL